MKKLYILLIISICCLGCQAEKLEKKQACLKESCFTVEVAKTPRQQAKGLMYRQSLGEKEGMLFIFSEPDLHGMWMKNMNFSIDIIWLDNNRNIIEINKNIPVCQQQECVSYGTSSSSSYVLELPAGTVDKLNLKLNDQIGINEYIQN